MSGFLLDMVMDERKKGGGGGGQEINGWMETEESTTTRS